MLFVNPYDCEAPATTEATWVIELDEPETVYSFQLAVTDPNMIDNAGQSNELQLCFSCFTLIHFFQRSKVRSEPLPAC